MLRYLLPVAFIIFYLPGAAQTAGPAPSGSTTLVLSISTPQPRLGESFKITLNADYLRAQIFSGLQGKVEIADNLGGTDEGKMTITVNALTKGKSEIGPLELTLNGVSYRTNKIEYEVIDPLPNVDKGIWIRKVKLSDSTFCIIIEQRIPAKIKTTVNSGTSISYTTEPEYSNILKFMDTYSESGLRSKDSYSNTKFSSITDEKGDQHQYMSAYSEYYFTIEDRSAAIVITGDKFENIPPGYEFQPIKVQ